jgi:putative DNA-invertase from lambdoid prophage Rac
MKSLTVLGPVALRARASPHAHRERFMRPPRTRRAAPSRPLSNREPRSSKAGFKLDEVICDSGVSGVSTKFAERPQGRRLFDLLRREDTLVVRWLIASAGTTTHLRNDPRVHGARRRHPHRDQWHPFRWLDPRAANQPTNRAIHIGQSRTLTIALHSGRNRLARIGRPPDKPVSTRANGGAHTYKGRKPSYGRKEFESAQALLQKSASVGEVARTTGLTRQTVYRIKDHPSAAEAALTVWGM